MIINWLDQTCHVLENPQRAPVLHEKHKLSLEHFKPGHIWVATSGTTSRTIKYVGLSKEALLCSAAAVNKRLHSAREDIWLKVLPSFHVGGLSIFARAFLCGAAVIDHSTEKWSAKKIVQVMADQGVTLTSLVPTQVYDLCLEQISAPPSLRGVFVGGGALRAELHQQARDLGWPLLASFGMTEAGSQVATALTAETLELTLLSHLQARVDAQQRLYLKSECLFSAYALFESKQVEFINPKVDGWWRSEDRVELHGETLRPLGRSNEVVKVLGELVDVARLRERLAQRLGRDFDWELLNVPDSRRENALVLVVAQGFELGGHFEQCEHVVQQFNAEVSGVERIQRLAQVESLPRTSLGKVALNELRALVHPI